jgi:AcrR family transcriptional regulator
MSLTEQHRKIRRARDHGATRASILDSARRVANRQGARELSLRSVAAEAGYAPAALYSYFRNKDELLLALAADDLSGLARAMREAVQATSDRKLSAAASVALDLLENTETIAAASSALPKESGSSESERVFNGRMIATLTALSEALGDGVSREAQADVVLIAATLTGLALLKRSGRLDALGFGNAELLARLEKKFSGGF